jgi:predicted glycosyltransferase involved in capsule biosynthesis
MNKTDLKDLTFLIPLRLDTIDRLENLIMITDFILANFDTNIQILEASAFNNQMLNKLLPPNVEFTFVEDLDPIFYRTNYINKMVNNCKTKYLTVWDSDVVTAKEQILESLQWLRNGEADFVYPYKGKLLDTTKTLRELYFKTRNISMLDKHKNKMKEMYPPVPLGGAFMVNRESYIKSGIENTKFYGWGLEDGERFYRWETLGFKIKRADGPMFHLSHDRGLNSNFQSNEARNKKLLDISRINSMTKDELTQEVESWKR